MKFTIFTRYKITVEAPYKSKVMSLILSNSLQYESAKVLKTKELELLIKKQDLNAYKALFESEKIKHSINEAAGVLKPLESLKGRYGLLVGIVFLIITIIYSSKVVWQINIDGNTQMTDEEIIEELKMAGFDLGAFIPKIDYEELHNRVLMNSKRLSWISVNITGNVANVKVREYKKAEEKSPPLYTNIVAKSDGYISEVLVLNGKKLVSQGDVVREGDILISGIINSQSQGLRLETAQGSVFAYVNKEINIKIPLKSVKKTYTGEKRTDKIYKIYNLPIKFSSKYGNQYEFCDTIEKKERLCIFGISSLPLEITKTTYYEYTNIEEELTPQTAQELAYAELRDRLDALLSGAELVNKSTKSHYDGEYFYLDCSIYCIEDIAKEQEFYVLE